MSDNYYSTIGILAIIIHAIINYKYYVLQDERKEIKEYKKYLNVIFLYFMTDVAWGFLNNIQNIPLLYLDTVLYYITMAFSVVLCCRYIISFLKLDNLWGKLLNGFGLLFGIGEIIVLGVNHFYHIFFWFDETGNYQAFTLRHIALFIQIAMFAIISIMSLIVAMQERGTVRSRNLTISLFGCCMTIALTAQSMYPLLPLYSMGLMLGTLIIYVFIHNEEVNEAKVIAESASAAKTSFLFSMSHDIRTPMNAIIGFRDLLEKNQEDAEKRANYLKKIKESSSVLLSIINNVLEMARIEKGVLELNESVWSAEQMNDSMYSVFTEMMKQKGLDFTREIQVQHHYVYCDAIKTREIFINIISNAYKYTESGGKIHMQLEELPTDKEGYAKYRTTISDTGMGMSEEFLPHLFEEFSRENNTTYSKIEGTGLGMPIVKRLVDFLGGQIEVTSKKGEGTTFRVTIHHRIADTTPMQKVEKDTSHEGFEGKRILLAEDNELNAEIAIAILSEIGFVIDRACDGQECLEKLTNAASGYYDLILMDVQMPRMNGYEATKAIRNLSDKQKSDIKILAMTANAFEEDKREAQKAGMNGHLAKPINVRELIKSLTYTLN